MAVVAFKILCVKVPMPQSFAMANDGNFICTLFNRCAL